MENNNKIESIQIRTYFLSKIINNFYLLYKKYPYNKYPKNHLFKYIENYNKINKYPLIKYPIIEYKKKVDK